MPDTADTPRIRAARSEELDDLLRLEQDSFAGDKLSRRQYRHHLRSSTARVLVAVGDRGLLASALMLFRRNASVARLYSIAVAAPARGQGVGMRLLDACETEARRRRCTRLRLEVRIDNLDAQRLYDRCGYRRIGQRPAYYQDGADAWLYEKALVPVAG